MKKIAFALVLICFLFPVLAKAQVGATLSNPINAGTFGSGIHNYSDTKNNSGYGNNYASAGSPFYGQPSEDIFYKIILQGDGQLEVSHCNSLLNDTYLHILNIDGSHRQSLDDYGPVCSNLKASMSLALPAGTYYIVSEGYGSSSGSITTTMRIEIQSVAAILNTNFIRSWTPQKPYSEVKDVIAASRIPHEVLQETDYFDGFNRPVQKVLKQISPLQKDKVFWHEYNSWGREEKGFLPFISNVVQNGDVVNDGNFKESANSQWSAFNTILYPDEGFFYSKLTIEKSPMERVLENYEPGNSWLGSSRGISGQYKVNTVLDDVQIWNISMASGSIPLNGGVYLPGQLYKKILSDEKGIQEIEYSDKEGNVILKKAQLTAAEDNGLGSNHNGWICTYYIYDDFGNLRFIITPKAVELLDGFWGISQLVADELCVRYEYDNGNRLIIKKDPGAGEKWFVYDQRDRLVMTQYPNQRSQQKWQYYQYDNLDRLVCTGLLNDPVNFNSLLFHLDNAKISTSYPNPSLYTNELLSQTYYDNYSWINGTGLSSQLDESNTSNTDYFYSSDGSFPYAQQIKQTKLMRGLITGSKAEVLGTNGLIYLYNVSFYDDKGRVIQTHRNNVSDGFDKTTTQYSWTGLPLRILQQISKGGTNYHSHNIIAKLNYDHAGRLTSSTKKINTTIGTINISTSDKIIATYEYNELGQLNKKNLGSNLNNGLPLETLVYDYNIRGWLTGINKSFITPVNQTKFFGIELAYDKPGSVNSTTSYLIPTFNGNIAGVSWKSKGDNIPRKYDFNYDNANQLRIAEFVQNTSSSLWDNNYIDFSVNNIEYDKNGNILKLNQNGFVLGGQKNIDDLEYKYLDNDISNKLKNVVDHANNENSNLRDFHYAGTKSTMATDFHYDENGNKISDLNKNISSITFNALNLPELITISTKGTIGYTYDALGNKLKKITQENNATVAYNNNNYVTNIKTTTSYIGGFIYQSKEYSNPALASLEYNEVLQFLNHEEGRARLVTSISGNKNYVFDYFIRDHLDNVRVVITDEQHQDTYPAATLENGAVNTEKIYYDIKNDNSHIIPTSSLPWYANAINSSYENNNGVPSPPDPTINRNGASANLYKLNGATGDRYGLGIALKVMAGDEINIYGKSVWHSTGQSTDNDNFSISSILNTFINSFVGTPAVSGTKEAVTGSILNSNSSTTNNLSSLLNDIPTPVGQSPKAYINWILFDEQFKPVQSGNGFDPINSQADEVKTHNTIPPIDIIKSGYLYVYCSNESNQDVYFDNFQVIHKRGALLEENHFYPEGLLMAGISSRAYGKLENKFGYQSKEFQNNEFYDGTGLEEYDFHARYYDPQLSRWWVQDPADQFASPYMAMGNNWPRYTDPDGRVVPLIAVAVGAFIGGTLNVVSHWNRISSFKDGLAAFGIGAAAGAAGVLTGGTAFAAAGGAAAGAGGLLAGMAGGAVGAAYSSQIQGVGNAIYFGDPYGPNQFLRDVAFGAALGGVSNGIAALKNGKPLLRGSVNVGNSIPLRGHVVVPNSQAITAEEALANNIAAGNSSTHGGLNGFKTYSSLTDKFGEGYRSIAVSQGKHLPIQLGQKLNSMSPGSWSKVYEAGILNGAKVETHYFFNATSRQYVNPFIKSSGWGRIFRGVTW